MDSEDRFGRVPEIQHAFRQVTERERKAVVSIGGVGEIVKGEEAARLKCDLDSGRGGLLKEGVFLSRLARGHGLSTGSRGRNARGWDCAGCVGWRGGS